jgi:spermidine synthase
MGVHLLFLPVFFASGFAALVYQMVWQRLLTFFSGADVYSVTIIVSAFMAGLGLGNLAGGHLADRLSPRRRILAFALAELAIAAFAFASIPVLYDILFLKLGARALPGGVVALVLFLVLLWPTFFMGLSLPLLSRVLTESVSVSARRIGGLYGWNTLGAAAGALLSVWGIVRISGFERAVHVAAALNLLCAAAALLLLRLEGRAATEAPAARDAAPASEDRIALPLRAWLGLYALSGFIALSLEIVWFRLLGTIHKPSSFTFATLLALYVLGVGGGALLGGRLARRARRPAAAFFLAQSAIGLYAAVSVALLAWGIGRFGFLFPLWEYVGQYETLELADSVAATFKWIVRLGQVAPYAHDFAYRFLLLYLWVPLFLIGPPTLLMGLSFAFLQRTVQTDLERLGTRVGWLQTANIAGSTLGAALTGLLLLHWLGTDGTLRLLAVLAGVFLVLFTRAAFSGAARSRATLAALVVTAAGAALTPSEAWLWARLHGTAPARIVQAEDGSGLSVIKEEENNGRRESVVYVDGLGQSALPYGGYHTVLGALPTLVHPSPGRIAIIGLGSGNTLYGAAGRRETWRIDCIEIVGSQMTALRALDAQGRYAELHALLADTRIRYHFTDGRSFLLRSDERYDVIEADALRPGSAYAGNLYSLEYFELLRSRLAPNGLAVSWAPTRRVHATFTRAFPYVLAIGDTLMGSNEPIPFDPDALRARVSDPFVHRHYERGGLAGEALLAAMLQGEIRRFEPGEDRSAFADINTDLHPKDEYLADRRFFRLR